jgi:hypothetical protein
LLAFSVHDESLLPPGRRMPESGLHFEPSSESRSLDPESYGSTWVSEAFVRATVAELAPAASCIRLPRALGRFQDLYAVDLSANAGARRFDPGPFGFLDRCTYEARKDGNGHLAIRGWAAQAAGSGEVGAVRIWLGESLAAEVRELQERPDVREAFPEASSRSGFHVLAPLPVRASLGSLPLVVEAESSSGVRAPIHAGTVANALFLSTRAELGASENARQREIDLRRQDAELAAVETEALRAASPRWKPAASGSCATPGSR